MIWRRGADGQHGSGKSRQGGAWLLCACTVLLHQGREARWPHLHPQSLHHIAQRRRALFPNVVLAEAPQAVDEGLVKLLVRVPEEQSADICPHVPQSMAMLISHESCRAALSPLCLHMPAAFFILVWKGSDVQGMGPSSLRVLYRQLVLCKGAEI